MHRILFAVKILHDWPFDFKSLETDQFLHFADLDRIQFAISFFFFWFVS